MKSQLFTRTDYAQGNYYWAVPNNCSFIFLSGCGGGGGGGGCSGTTGASGGSSGGCIDRLPVAVLSGSVVAFRIGKGLTGGAAGSAGQSFSSGLYEAYTCIVGPGLVGIVGYERQAGINYIMIGHGTSGSANSGYNTGPAVVSHEGRTSHAWGYTNSLTASVWGKAWSGQYAGIGLVEQLVSNGEGGRVGPNNPYSFAAQNQITVCGNGVGVAQASDATNGSGGPGGGCLFGRGGTGGQYPGSVDGGDGTGYGSGGGGAANGGSGGDGADGLVIIEW